MSAVEIERLSAILASEECLYRELLELLQNERERIVDLDADGLGDIARQKENLAVEGRLIEQGRLALCAQLASALGIASDPPTLSEICERLGSEGASLREAHTRLVAVVGAARELVEANRILGGDRLSFVRNTLGLLGSLLPGHPGNTPAYQRNGAVPTPSLPGGHIVRRSA